jgi:DNA-binding response OmpR family regulator
MPKILIVEDDPQIAKSLTINLRLSGHETFVATSVAEARMKLGKDHYQMICLDIGLPDGSGMDLCREIRESGDDTPILFLSALVDEATVVRGINLGADDYLRKPFGVEELKVRMQKIMKKFSPGTAMIKFGPLTIDPVERIVTVMDEMVNLGRKEVEILMLLAKKSGNLVTRETIIANLYDDNNLYDRTIDSHMSHLRKKLKEVAGTTLQISSVYGLGYRLQCS